MVFQKPSTTNKSSTEQNDYNTKKQVSSDNDLQNIVNLNELAVNGKIDPLVEEVTS